MGKTFEVENKLPNIIGSGTKIAGDLETNGDLRVDGVIEGNIIVRGKLVLGQGGVIKGTIKCSHAEIAGQFEGKVEVTELLSLRGTAIFTGDMDIAKLSIEPGAAFDGTCKMKSSAVAANDVAEQK